MSQLSSRTRVVGAGVFAAAVLAATAGPAAAVIHTGSHVTEFKTATVAPGQAGSATASCPSGNKAVIGGVYWYVWRVRCLPA